MLILLYQMPNIDTCIASPSAWIGHVWTEPLWNIYITCTVGFVDAKNPILAVEASNVRSYVWKGLENFKSLWCWKPTLFSNSCWLYEIHRNCYLVILQELTSPSVPVSSERVSQHRHSDEERAGPVWAAAEATYILSGTPYNSKEYIWAWDNLLVRWQQHVFVVGGGWIWTKEMHHC